MVQLLLTSSVVVVVVEVVVLLFTLDGCVCLSVFVSMAGSVRPAGVSCFPSRERTVVQFSCSFFSFLLFVSFSCAIHLLVCRLVVEVHGGCLSRWDGLFSFFFCSRSFATFFADLTCPRSIRNTLRSICLQGKTTTVLYGCSTTQSIAVTVTSNLRVRLGGCRRACLG